MDTWPSRNWIWSSSPPARWHRRAQVRRRSCGASLSMPARAAAARTTSHSTFGDMPSPQTRPALLIARKTDPLVMTAAAVHASTAALTHVGIGDGAHMAGLAKQIGDHPVLLPLLDGLKA